MSDKMNNITAALNDEYGWQQTLIANVGVDVIDLLLRKNRNYGGSVFTTPVLAPDVDTEAAIRVRMSDKVARIQNLLEGNPDLVGESLNDTWMDLLGYIIILIAFKRDQDVKQDPALRKHCEFGGGAGPAAEVVACEHDFPLPNAEGVSVCTECGLRRVLADHEEPF